MIGDLKFKSLIERQRFSRSVNVTTSLINDLEIITDLNLPGKSDFKRNDLEKYCGRTFYNNDSWFGIRDFATCRLSVGFLELYQYQNKPIQSILDTEGFNYEIIDTPIDKGHWYYIKFESICCFKDVVVSMQDTIDSNRRQDIEELIKSLMEVDEEKKAK